MSDPPIIRDATKPPPPVTTALSWVRMSTGKVPPETDQRTFLLQLVDGTFTLGRRRTLLRVVGASGQAFIRASSVPHVPTLETHFVEAATGSVPIDGVHKYAAIDPPP